MGRKENLCALLVVMRIGIATMKNSMEGSPSKYSITKCSSNSTFEYLSKRTKTPTQTDICTPMFIAALFTIAKMWKQSKRPSMNKLYI